MCGITGFLEGKSTGNGVRERLLLMSCKLTHRGPDDGDVWFDSATGVGFAHRRLAIVDLSEVGRQPMQSACGRFVTVFNGELYNFRQIRRELEEKGFAPPWRGHSDTEVMLAAISAWGLKQAVERFVGMFAFALWDRSEQVLHLVRDRIGEKPLYYTRIGGDFLFASELKALRVHPAWVGEIDNNALALYLKYAYVPSPYSIYKGVFKLEPGKILSFSLHTARCRTDYKGDVVTYWDAVDSAVNGIRNPFSGSIADARDKLETLLKEAVAGQMVADVPLGAFLSGGVDSSLIAALMQSQSERPIKTFTIGFSEAAYDEAQYAKEVAKHLGTDHTEWYVSADDAMSVIPRLPELYDEPFADSSQIPTHLLSSLTRRHVTVSLSGDGADELFGGYNRYVWASSIWRMASPIPHIVRRAMAAAMQSVAPESCNRFFQTFGNVMPNRLKIRYPSEKLYKLASVIRFHDPRDIYEALVTQWSVKDLPVRFVRSPQGDAHHDCGWSRFKDFTESMMCEDLTTYLPDDILVKVDRASMGVSLESRAPFLDHRVVEFAWSLPLRYKIMGTKGKAILRDVLYRHIPATLIERPKTGFSMPLGDWLRGPLRDWAEELLSAERMNQAGYIDSRYIHQKWDEHISGRRNWQYQLWTVLMFQAWLERWHKI